MSIVTLLLEFMYPRWCCNCQKYGSLLCTNCFANIEFATETLRTSNYLDSVSSLVVLGPVSRSIITQLKYHSVKEISILCARLMYICGNFPDCEALTSIPLHPYRINTRGFNQAEEIARELSRLVQKPYIPCLKRVKHTTNLASVADPQERKRLIRNQFEPVIFKTVQHKISSLLLVDDVWTTGATLEEAARVLKINRAITVHGYTFAHGQ